MLRETAWMKALEVRWKSLKELVIESSRKKSEIDWLIDLI